MRKVVAAVLFGIAGASTLLAVFGFLTLFDEYKDSPDSLYIGWGVLALAVAVAAAVGGALLLREP